MTWLLFIYHKTCHRRNCEISIILYIFLHSLRSVVGTILLTNCHVTRFQPFENQNLQFTWFCWSPRVYPSNSVVIQSCNAASERTSNRTWISELSPIVWWRWLMFVDNWDKDLEATIFFWSTVNFEHSGPFSSPGCASRSNHPADEEIIPKCRQQFSTLKKGATFS